MNEQTKAVVSVSEMARMVGLSRQRFYQLQGTTFPEPQRDPETNRPFYDEEGQRICLEVRRRNCGVDGKPVLFYAPRHPLGQQQKMTKRPRPKPKPKSQHADLIDDLNDLGLESVSATQVESALSKLYPDGVQELDSGDVIRAVFLHLKRQEHGA